MRKLVVLGLVLLASAGHAEPRAGARAPHCEGRCLAVAFADALSSRSSRSSRSSHVLPVETSELRMDAVVVFEPASARVYSASRERLMRVAERWRKNPTWSVITVEGVAAPVAGGVELAQRRAEKIRGYLVRYGVDPGLVVAAGRTAPTRVGRVDLKIELGARLAIR